MFSYERVRRLSKLTDDETAEYLGYLRAREVSEMIFPGPAPRVVPHDSEYDPVAHTAVVGGADILCTLNRHFFAEAARGYCRERGVAITPDLELLDLLRSTK